MFCCHFNLYGCLFINVLYVSLTVFNTVQYSCAINIVLYCAQNYISVFIHSCIGRYLQQLLANYSCVKQ